MQKPPTYDQQFMVYQPGLLPALKRDLKLLKYLAMVVFFWSTRGRKIRRAQRNAVLLGKPLILEDEVLPILLAPGPGQMPLPPQRVAPVTGSASMPSSS